MKQGLANAEIAILPTAATCRFTKSRRLTTRCCLDFLARQRRREAVNASLPLSAFRPLQLLPVLLGISLITFMMVRAIPRRSGAYSLGVQTPAALPAFARSLPLMNRCGFSTAISAQPAAGRAGKSIVSGWIPEADCLAAGTDAVAGAGSVLLAVALTVPLAAIAARQRGRLADRLIRLFTTAGLSSRHSGSASC